MAIPTAEFAARAGLVLMRQNVSTGEWFRVRWLSHGTDFSISTPGPGTWAYAVWLVVGGSSNCDAAETYGELCSVVVTEMKR